MPQGLFISYRRSDSSAFAARLYEALKAAFPLKKIFFDIDAPAAGSKLKQKIERELESSQVVIVIIGPQWNRGRRMDNGDDYVRLELRHALRLRDQDRIEIFPVLIDGGQLPKDELPADLTGLKEFEYLPVSGEEDVAKIVDRSGQLLPTYWVGGHDDIVAWRLSFVDFLQRLIDLDVNEVPTIDATPQKLIPRLRFEIRRWLTKLGLMAPDPGDEGSAEQWAAIFERHPETWRAIFSKDEEIVGYWHVAPLNAEDYKKLIAGRFKAGMVTYEKLTLFEKRAGIYNLFFVIVVVSERHRNARLHRHLFYSFFDVLDKLSLAEEPVFVGEVAADVWTDEGIKLAEGFGMKRVGRRTDDPNILIYSVSTVDLLNHFTARKRYAPLRERYMTAGFSLA